MSLTLPIEELERCSTQPGIGGGSLSLHEDQFHPPSKMKDILLLEFQSHPRHGSNFLGLPASHVYLTA